MADDADAAFVEYEALPPTVAAMPKFKPCAKGILRIIKSVPLFNTGRVISGRGSWGMPLSDEREDLLHPCCNLGK